MTHEEPLKQLLKTNEAFRQWFDNELLDIVGMEAKELLKCYNDKTPIAKTLPGFVCDQSRRMV